MWTTPCRQLSGPRNGSPAAVESLRLAKTLEEGERFRFSLGATSVLFVNLRERNSVDSEGQVHPCESRLSKGPRAVSMGYRRLGEGATFGRPGHLSRAGLIGEELAFSPVL